MKVMVCSDPHFDLNSDLDRDMVREFIKFVKTKNVDRIAFAGDLSGSAVTTMNVVDLIEKETGVPVSFITGNHDIWVDINQSSDDAYNELLKHPSCLINSPVRLTENTILIGFMGWYDYSFGPKTIPNYQFKAKKKKKIRDGSYARWSLDDPSFLERELDGVTSILDQHKDKQVILLTHFVPYFDFLTVSSSNTDWNFSNAYMGGEGIGELVDLYPNIKTLVFGHTHKRYGNVVYRGKNIICNPLGYLGLGEWKTNDPSTEFELVTTILDVD